jgi:23S rRNA pseudouridine1911/1915/1917 synthase
MDNPYILKETADFAVVFKPPKMHCTVNSYKLTNEGQKTDSTILEWYTANSSSVFDIMHRLDFETHGLVLFAKNENSYNFFKSAQDKGEFIKEYSAVCTDAGFAACIEGFPECNYSRKVSQSIESYFRPYGPGRKQVRPVIEDGKKHKEIAKDKGGFYRTEIISINGDVVTVQIKRGFRHQIRCHLCWIGFPIQNDPLYSHLAKETAFPEYVLALRSHALFFPDPKTGKQQEYQIDKLTGNSPHF